MSSPSQADPTAARIRQLLDSLEVPMPWDLDRFIQSIGHKRGKPIRLVPHPGLSGLGQPCGIWIGRDADDIVVYDSATSGYHTEQIILHELGHLLLEHTNHGSASVAASVSIQDLLPDVDPATISHVLGRTVYDDAQESQAELFASLVMCEYRGTSPKSTFLRTFLHD